MLADERDQFVTLLTSLDRLGTVGDTRDQRRQPTTSSSALKSLDPVMTELTKAGDDLPKSLRAAGHLPVPEDLGERRCKGDYTNLYISLDLNLTDLLDNLLKPRAASGRHAQLARRPRTPARARYRGLGGDAMIRRSTKIQLLVFVVIRCSASATSASTTSAWARTCSASDGCTVSADFPDSGGIFSNAEVTYRGVTVGKVGRCTCDYPGRTAPVHGVRVDLRLDSCTHAGHPGQRPGLRLGPVGGRRAVRQPRADQRRRART